MCLTGQLENSPKATLFINVVKTTNDKQKSKVASAGRQISHVTGSNYSVGKWRMLSEELGIFPCFLLHYTVYHAVISSFLYGIRSEKGICRYLICDVLVELFCSPENLGEIVCDQLKTRCLCDCLCPIVIILQRVKGIE